MAAPRFNSPCRILGAILATLVLWVATLDWGAPAGTGLDASWQEVLVYARAHGWQFGRDLVFTYGPWGGVLSHYLLPQGLLPKALWECAGKGLMAAGFVYTLRPLPAARQGLILGAFIALGAVFGALTPSSNFLQDAECELFMAVIILFWLLPGKESAWVAAAGLVFLAFLSQVKFTFGLVAIPGVGLAAALRMGRGQWGPGLALVAGFACAFMGWWLAAGQTVGGIYDYFRSGLEISGGYPWAMRWGGNPGPILPGVVTLALNVAFAVQLACAQPRPPAARASALFLGLFWFLLWKHGFTRADLHVFGFFGPSLLLALLLPPLLLPGRRAGWFQATAVVCAAAIALTIPELGRRMPTYAWRQVRSAVIRVCSLRQSCAELQARVVGATEAGAAPSALRSAVGGNSVDLVGYEQGLLLLDGLNYRPRPVFQSYSAYTPELMRRNARFLCSAAAPSRVLVRLATIDNRFPAQDDALVLAELPRHYDLESVLPEGLLLRAKAVRPGPQPFRRELLSSRVVDFGEVFEPPPSDGHPVWMRADIRPTTWTRLRALLFKPPEIVVNVTAPGGDRTAYRIVPAIAQEGFIIEPLILDNADYAAFLCGRGSPGPSRLSFEVQPGWEDGFDRPLVQFFRMPELKLASPPNP